MGANPSSSPKASVTFDNLPKAYEHLSQFPVLAKQARLRRVKDANDSISNFLQVHWNIVTYIGEYLTVWDRLNFLKTHKVLVEAKQLRQLFSGPSRDARFLYSTSLSTPPLSPTTTYTNRYLQTELRYRNNFLCRVVPLAVVSHSLHRVLKGWLGKLNRRYNFTDIQAMVKKLMVVFRPTDEVWKLMVNSFGEDGMTVLTYAVAANVPSYMISQLVSIPGFDPCVPDVKFSMTPAELAHKMGRSDLLCLFKDLASPFPAYWKPDPACG